ncbi:3-phosphoshikimate 1-carboxyvinyltransferase [Enterococcus phoeniculicola]|jgi:3-phosphoshikimate 1-carboxyvinyltransferase|uniref:3-phosphoshikimate 1-carboxyvinyltransferase n=1 Tax=Enterococcus phoeniculicola ATCC BAA-412 TaxID=1158610 RepID=R3TYI0_9ENTE|nr:3-phosphoshikimate 1-carboxyvinyltransferase [Enterococcus phoeniculicola]EOL46218.1 3-phosphoshikimate 1-carboxyvinyltransferase [Enterococcus phoeniculicola ATCC BAA-412]EOT76937.1 3-phosphoshikimate 1-carboxyvinyltransferase [Enterococcus phoeniculicola ATCC BAA-412]OJG71212.1 3-phosphoshikimate 1-carboxyvinyltransferase [Enterococcus phoeniculicola]
MKLVTNKQQLQGTLTVPADKSISHRSIMFGAMAKGTTTIHNFLRGEDCLATLHAFKTLGVPIEDDGAVITIHGRGTDAFIPADAPIDVGNSGTTIRLLMGILAGTNFSTTLTGDDSLSKRPMARVMDPINQMNGEITGNKHTQFPPITIQGRKTLHAITYEMPVASAQVKSAILFAALQANGESIIIEKEPSRNHTEEMIRQFGGQIEIQDKMIRLKGPQTLSGQTVVVPGDISSAAFFLVAALITKNSTIQLTNVGINPTRTGILDVIRDMGGEIQVSESDSENQSATITARYSSLKGCTIGGAIIPRLIDELPIIALLATQAVGQTIIRDAQELKVKETNRIDAVARELTKMGASIQATEDGLIINGPTPLHGANVTSYGDHRIGMMLQIAALLVADGEVELDQAEAVSVSYPNFFSDLTTLLPGGAI